MNQVNDTVYKKILCENLEKIHKNKTRMFGLSATEMMISVSAHDKKSQ